MPEYLPSLSERKRQFLENCCGDTGDMGSGEIDGGEVPTAADENPTLTKAIDKVRSSRRKKKWDRNSSSQ
jgi:hypothetical protein